MAVEPITHYEFELRPIDKLKPFPRNSRKHSDTQIQQVINSITEFGFTNPILIDEYHTIIAGHCRLLAAKKIGLENVPCITLYGLSQKQKRAYVIADNKLALNAEWDMQLLEQEVQSLQDEDFNIELTGFSELELAKLFATDEVDDLKDEWKDMPEFEQKDKMAFRSIIVHFKDQYAVDEFAEKMVQNITEKTKMIWFPFIETEKVADKRYANES